MKNIYFIIGISVSLLLLYLILYNLTNTIYVEGLRGGSSDHNYARSASSDIDKGKTIYPIKTIEILSNKEIFSYLYFLNIIKKSPIIKLIPKVKI